MISRVAQITLAEVSRLDMVYSMASRPWKLATLPPQEKMWNFLKCVTKRFDRKSGISGTG